MKFIKDLYHVLMINEYILKNGMNKLAYGYKDI